LGRPDFPNRNTSRIKKPPLFDEHFNVVIFLFLDLSFFLKLRIFFQAFAEVQKGLETAEYACAIPELISGRVQEVSRGVYCQDRRDPIGIVASIVPFNFPMMVPFWTLPIALVCGNCMILKPSEKVPLTMNRVAELLQKAGVPPGVFQIVNGTKDAVEAICDNPAIRAVTFVGSTKIAELVAKRCRNLNKRVLALGGAKNNLVVAPDRHLDMASSDIVASFTGCTGQRCMAASAMLSLGHQQDILDEIVRKAGLMQPGQEAGQVGPVIDKMSADRILRYIDEAEKAGVKILLDGRTWVKERNPNCAEVCKKGNWIGPTVLLHTNRDDPALKDEIFGPVLSILEVHSREEAVEIQNSSVYGNAASIYTGSGAIADWFTKRFHAGMLGVNIGVPVPREPFSFGGSQASKFGDMDITGDGGMEFFTERKKVTTKWTPPPDKNWMN
jgi:malonate-semialdehyde dehydrogenase (acetylating) / methylmalonate-semialdehyde dehydrogenase